MYPEETHFKIVGWLHLGSLHDRNDAMFHYLVCNETLIFTFVIDKENRLVWYREVFVNSVFDLSLLEIIVDYHFIENHSTVLLVPALCQVQRISLSDGKHLAS